MSSTDLLDCAGSPKRHVRVQHRLAVDDTGQGRIYDGVCTAYAGHIRQTSRADSHLQERSWSSMMSGTAC